VTGSGKTYTIANVIAEIGLPTLVLSHNKTLAAQLYGEMRTFFPENGVGYFVSYYDYYQPEAYVPATNTFIEKDASINDDIDRLRLSATSMLLERPDVVIVASVSCIYGLGSPEEFRGLMIDLSAGQKVDRDQLLRKLIEIQYARNEYDFARGTFRVRGEVVEIRPAYEEHAVRIEFDDDEVTRISVVDPTTGTIKARAVFVNADRFLSPGLFVRVRLPLSSPKASVLVTDRAVGTDQGNKFVYVVNDKKVVEYRAVKLGPLADDGLRVIAEGLNAGELVIVNGIQRARPGITVTPQEVSMLPQAAPPAAAPQKPAAPASHG